MGFAGLTFRIPCDKGGFTANPNIDGIDPVMMVDGSKNVNIHQNGRESRGGTSHVDAAAMPGSSQVNGLFDFTQQDGTQFVLRATIDGKLYKNDTDTIKTGLTIGDEVFYNFEVMNNEVYVSNGNDRPQVWDGAAGTSTDITTVPVDWSGGAGNWPKQILKHGRGNSERLWAILPDDNNIYYSVLNDGVSEADFGGAGSGQIYIETGNEGGLTGMVEFGEQLIVFTKKRVYLIDDSSATITDWGYVSAPFVGGVPHHRLIVKIDNDVFCFADDGNIFSFTTVQAAQDYKRASISRPAFIDKWIRDNTDLSSISKFHAVFDPVLRSIKFFVMRTGQSQIDTALPYFIDRGPIEGWGPPHDNIDNDSGYRAAYSAVIRNSDGIEKIYTGGYSGFVWVLETANKNDNSTSFSSGFKTPFIATENPRVTKKFFRGTIVTRPRGDYELKVVITLAGLSVPTQGLSLLGTGGKLDTFILDTDVLGGDEILDLFFDIRATGKRAQFEVFNSNVDEDFFISQLLFDYKNLGARPQ